MSVTFFTYLWHYLIARTIYDELLRPALHRTVTALVLVACLAAAAFLLGRWAARKGHRL